MKVVTGGFYKKDVERVFQRVLHHIGPNPLDFKLVHYAIVVEIIEESRNVHSMARDTPDETREKEIRDMYVQLTEQRHVAFV
jgi:hypothetical protein